MYSFFNAFCCVLYEYIHLISSYLIHLNFLYQCPLLVACFTTSVYYVLIFLSLNINFFAIIYSYINHEQSSSFV